MDSELQCKRVYLSKAALANHFQKGEIFEPEFADLSHLLMWLHYLRFSWLVDVLDCFWCHELHEGQIYIASNRGYVSVIN